MNKRNEGDGDRPDRESLIDSVGLPDELLNDENVMLVVALAEGACGCRKLGRGWSCGVSVLVDESVASG